MAHTTDAADEKLGTQVDTAAASSSTLALGGVAPVREKALLRKLDRHLMPAVGVLYLMSFLDRSNCSPPRPRDYGKRRG